MAPVGTVELDELGPVMCAARYRPWSMGMMELCRACTMSVGAWMERKDVTHVQVSEDVVELRRRGVGRS